MQNAPIFRQKALDAHGVKWLGDIILVRPLSFSMLTCFAVLLASLVMAFLVWGTYTKRSTVSGQLLPEGGLLKVFTPQFGIVLEKSVIEGQIVKQDAVLYVLSSDRQSSTLGATQAAISSRVEARQQSLHEEREKTIILQSSDRDLLAKKIEGLGAELDKLVNQINSQKRRIKLAEDVFARYQGLLSQDFISREQLQQKENDLLEQRIRLQGLERDRLSLSRELLSHQKEQQGLVLKHQNQIAQIDRNIAATGQELTESEAKRRIVITAPVSGIVTAAFTEVGQAVDTSKPLVSIVPQGAHLQAQLYAPSKAIGFIKTGDEVLVRFQAYPYQKFGHGKGKVISVARTALPSHEQSAVVSAVNNGNPAGNEPLYRITVDLSSQTINAYGKPQLLQAGMLLEADVMQDTRRLYEWVLEPLYSLSGKF